MGGECWRTAQQRVQPCGFSVLTKVPNELKAQPLTKRNEELTISSFPVHCLLSKLAAEYDERHKKTLDRLIEEIRSRLDFIGVAWVDDDEDDDNSNNSAVGGDTAARANKSNGTPNRTVRLLDYACGTGVGMSFFFPFLLSIFYQGTAVVHHFDYLSCPILERLFPEKAMARSRAILELNMCSYSELTQNTVSRVRCLRQ